MCGRFTNRLTWEEIVRLYRLTIKAPPHNLPPHYNICPTDPADVQASSLGGSALVEAIEQITRACRAFASFRSRVSKPFGEPAVERRDRPPPSPGPSTKHRCLAVQRMRICAPLDWAAACDRITPAGVRTRRRVPLPCRSIRHVISVPRYRARREPVRAKGTAQYLILDPKCNVRDMSVTNSCRLQLLARRVGCRQDAHFLRQFESRLKLRLGFILAALPTSDGTEAEVALHREWSHAELVGDRGSGAIMAHRRCVCWVAAHGEIAEQMFQPRHSWFLAPQRCGLVDFARRLQGDVDPVVLKADPSEQKMRVSTGRRNGRARDSSFDQACGLPLSARLGNKRKSNGTLSDRLRLRHCAAWFVRSLAPGRGWHRQCGLGELILALARSLQR